MTASAAVRKRAEEGRELTRAQKLRVLKDTRALLDQRWVSGSWSRMIDEVEHFCLYGGLAVSAGLEPGGGQSDDLISQCSLTSTLFDVLPKENKHRKQAERRIREGKEDFPYPCTKWEEAELAESILLHKVEALQGVNDQQGRAAVLRTLDKAIKKLEGGA